jgi:protein-S-isoprenylcysteine O-methyltransferase Ste14
MYLITCKIELEKMAVTDIVIILCWVIFFAVILVGAFKTKPTVEREPFSNKLFYALPIVLAIFLLFKGLSSQTAPGTGLKQPLYPLYVQVLPATTSIMIIGVVLTIFGLFIALWARVILGTNWSGSVTFKEEHELIEKGPYAYVRHPLYTGLLMMFLGTAVESGTLGGLIGFPFFFIGCWIKLKQEESLMTKHFGEEYTRYTTKVKALIPYLL